MSKKRLVFYQIFKVAKEDNKYVQKIQGGKT